MFFRNKSRELGILSISMMTDVPDFQIWKNFNSKWFSYEHLYITMYLVKNVKHIWCNIEQLHNNHYSEWISESIDGFSTEHSNLIPIFIIIQWKLKKLQTSLQETFHGAIWPLEIITCIFLKKCTIFQDKKSHNFFFNGWIFKIQNVWS